MHKTIATQYLNVAVDLFLQCFENADKEISSALGAME